jgi:hypothetical protein
MVRAPRGHDGEPGCPVTVDAPTRVGISQRTRRRDLAADPDPGGSNMRKLFALLALVALAATAVVGVGAIGASASSDATSLEPWGRNLHSSAAQPATRKLAGAERIVLRPRGGQEKFLDLDGNGRDSVGDELLFTENLLNGSGKAVGRDWVTCKLQFRFTLQCEGTLLLFGRGTIELAGTISENHNFVAVTGGTGEFADAGGEANVGLEDRLVVSLLHLK